MNECKKKEFEINADNLNKWYNLLWFYMASYATFLTIAILFASIEEMRDTQLAIQLALHIITIILVSGTTTHRQLKYVITTLPILFGNTCQLLYESYILISECFSCTLIACEVHFSLFLLTSSLVWILTFFCIMMLIISCLIYKYTKLLTKCIKKKSNINSKSKSIIYNPE